MKGALRIGLAGLGTVGKGVLDSLTTQREAIGLRAGRPIAVAGVCARSRTRDRGHDLSGAAWFEDATKLATSPDIDVFVELIGGEEGVARASVEAALKAGKPVVTANKALLAHHGAALAGLADEHGALLNFEAAVAGGIPIVKTMRESLAGNGIRRVFGILNGTCNYILTKMTTEGREFADVLAEAQKLGYAEADPTFDVGGFDTAHKLAILTSLAFGTVPDLGSISVVGIENITREDIRNADDLGYKIKLLGVCLDSEDGIEQRVHPTLVPQGLADRRRRRRLQRRDREGRLRRRPHARGPRCGRASDGVERALRPVRHRARQPPPGFRRAGEASQALPAGAPTGARGRLLRGARALRPPRLGRRDRQPAGGREDLHRKHRPAGARSRRPPPHPSSSSPTTRSSTPCARRCARSKRTATSPASRA